MISNSWNKYRRPFFKRIFRIGSFILAGIAITTLTGLLIFYLNKDKIAQRIIGLLNEMQNGKIIVEDISLSPFKHFPAISVRLDQATFTELNDESYSKPFIEINRLYVSFDILKLIDGDVSVSKVTLDGGHVDFRMDKEGSFNLFRASSTGSTDSTIIEKESPQNDNNLTLELSGIEIRNLNFSLKDDQSGFSIDLLINDLSAVLTHAENQTDIDAAIDFKLNSLGLNNKSFLRNKDFSIVTGFSYNNLLQLLSVTNGRLNHGDLSFIVDGSYDLDKSVIDLKVDGSDNGLNLLSLIIEQDVISMNRSLVDQGDLYFNGTIRGKTNAGIPNLKFNFGAQNIKLNLPNGQRKVKAFSFKGMLETGDNPDLSSAILQINDLKATLEEGEFTGSLEINNFADPSIILKSEGKVNLKNFTEIFKFDELDSMAGKLEFKTDIHIVIDSKSGTLPSNHGTIFLGFEDVAMKLAHFPLIHGLNGTLINSDSIINLENISFQIDSSNIQIKGQVINLVARLLRKSEIIASLEITSERLNLNDLTFEKNQIVSDLSLSLSLKIPEGDYWSTFIIDLTQLKASPEGYPEIESLTGSISYDERQDLILLEAKNVKLLSSGDIVEFSGSVQVDSLVTKMDLQELNIYSEEGNLAFQGSAELDSSSINFNTSIQSQNLSLPGFIQKFSNANPVNDSLDNSSLNGSVFFQGDINFSHDLSGSFQLLDSDITYFDNVVDTVNITNLNLDVEYFNYMMSDTFSVRNFTGFEGDLKIASLSTKYFNDSSTTIAIRKEKNVISLDVISTSIIDGNTGKSDLIIDLSETSPKFIMNYQLDEAPLGSFLADSIIRGNINFQLHLESEGSNTNQILSNAKGNALVKGENIRINGFDLDEILANYKKSQNFRLTDVGAFMLVGPLGPLVTKGHDFAKLTKINPDDSTIIIQLYSQWEINNQIIKTRDVAFTTNRSRIAFDGSINLSDLTIPGFTVAVVDARGCSLMDQTITGTFSEPELSELNVVGTLFGAVINIFKIAAGNQCTPIYVGTVAHPPKK